MSQLRSGDHVSVFLVASGHTVLFLGKKIGPDTVVATAQLAHRFHLLVHLIGLLTPPQLHLHGLATGRLDHAGSGTLTHFQSLCPHKAMAISVGPFNPV